MSSLSPASVPVLPGVPSELQPLPTRPLFVPLSALRAGSFRCEFCREEYPLNRLVHCYAGDLCDECHAEAVEATEVCEAVNAYLGTDLEVF